MAVPFEYFGAAITTGTSRSVTVSAATGPGDTLCVTLSVNNTSATVISAVTDSQGNVYTLDTFQNAAAPSIYFYRSPGATGGPGGAPTKALSTSDTFSFSCSNTSSVTPLIGICAPGVGPVDQIPVNSTGTGTSGTNSLTPAVDGETAVSGIMVGSGSTAILYSGPFTDVGFQQSASALATDMGWRQMGAGTGGVSQTATCTWTTSVIWRMGMWLFLPGSAVSSVQSYRGGQSYQRKQRVKRQQLPTPPPSAAAPATPIVVAWTDANRRTPQKRNTRGNISEGNPPNIIVPAWMKTTAKQPKRPTRGDITSGQPPGSGFPQFPPFIARWMDAAERPETYQRRPRSVIRQGNPPNVIVPRLVQAERSQSPKRPRSTISSPPVVTVAAVVTPIAPAWMDAVKRQPPKRPRSSISTGMTPGSGVASFPPIMARWMDAAERPETYLRRPRSWIATGNPPKIIVPRIVQAERTPQPKRPLSVIRPAPFKTVVAVVTPIVPGWLKAKLRQQPQRRRSVLAKIVKTAITRFNFCDQQLGGTVAGNAFGGSTSGNAYGGTAVGKQYGGTATGNLYGGTGVVNNKYGGTQTETNTYGGSNSETNMYGGSVTCPSN